MHENETYDQALYAELGPDLTDQKDRNEFGSKWHCFEEKSGKSFDHKDNIIIDPEIYPVGTKVIIYVPNRPEVDFEQEKLNQIMIRLNDDLNNEFD